MKYFWQDLKEGVTYWVTGRQSYGYFSYVSVRDRWEELVQMIWHLLRKTLYCPLGKHYVKWNSGNPKCILCNLKYSKIFPKDKV